MKQSRPEINKKVAIYATFLLYFLIVDIFFISVYYLGNFSNDMGRFVMAVRISNMELLRIFAMFLIVVSHVAYHSGLPVFDVGHEITFNYILHQLFVLFGRIGTVLFVMLTGFFAIKSIFKVSSLSKLWLLTFFYSVVIFLCFAGAGRADFNLKNVIETVLPVSFNQYWFVSCYFFLYLLSPLLNICIKNLNKRQHFAVCAFMLTFWSIIPSLVLYPGYINGYHWSILAWFVVLYFIGSYIRLYVQPDYLVKNAKKIRISLIIAGIGMVGYLIILNLLARSGLHLNMWAYTDRNNIFVMMMAVLIFLVFVGRSSRSVAWINRVSVCMIGVYLVHCNKYTLPWLMRHVFNARAHFEDSCFGVRVLYISVLVFVGSLAVEYIRRTLMKKYSEKFTGYMQKYDLAVQDFMKQQ